jgi:hypothetical protein
VHEVASNVSPLVSEATPDLESGQGARQTPPARRIRRRANRPRAEAGPEHRAGWRTEGSEPKGGPPVSRGAGHTATTNRDDLPPTTTYGSKKPGQAEAVVVAATSEVTVAGTTTELYSWDGDGALGSNANATFPGRSFDREGAVRLGVARPQSREPAPAETGAGTLERAGERAEPTPLNHPSGLGEGSDPDLVTRLGLVPRRRRDRGERSPRATDVVEYRERLARLAGIEPSQLERVCSWRLWLQKYRTL